MNKLRPLALLCSGRVSRSPLIRLAQLGANLTWVKSTSYRVASRAVNALGAGVPVATVAEMAGAAVWLVSVPDAELKDTLSELRSAGVDWKRRSLLILSPEADSAVAVEFRSRGAAVASFCPIDEQQSRFVAEGESDAVRAVRALVGDTRPNKVVEIRKGAKAKYLAGARAATKDVLPLIAEALDCFQAAGISNADAKSITESLMGGSMRLYFRAGRRTLEPRAGVK
jgi:predicted short-subunit dehydrogenase-like oxidoreductase (DUF2520 family)